MKTSAFCPISNKRINEKVARLNAGFGLALLLLFGVTENSIPVLFLGIDFLLRSTNWSNYSPISTVSKHIVAGLKLKPQYINEGPKRFAARIGVFFTMLIIASFYLFSPITAFIIAIILGVFSFLESVFGLCVACKIYPFVYRICYKESFTVTN